MASKRGERDDPETGSAVSVAVRLRPYQEELVASVVADLSRPGDDLREVVLAACPGSGKTLMSIEVISRLLASGAVTRVLVLAHGTTLLRSQYAEALADRAPPFSWSLFTRRSDRNYVPISQIDSQVVIAIPQSLRAEVVDFDLVVVDEAHQFYGEPLVSGIISRVHATRALLLTGTPAPFVASGKTIFAAPMQEIYAAGKSDPSGPWISDAAVKLLASRYDLRHSQYNDDGEVRTSVALPCQETTGTLDDLGYWITKNHPGSPATWPARAGLLGKTLIVCRSQSMARDAADYFSNAGIRVVVSTSDTDDGSAIRRFKDDTDIAVLIVVFRANIGFDFPSLGTTVDMTCSISIDRIFQMFSRVVRPREGVAKTFIKFSSRDMFDHTKAILQASLLLASRQTYLSWNGSNLYGLQIARDSPFDREKRPDSSDTGRAPMPTLDPGFLVFEDFIQTVIDDAGVISGGTTLGAVLEGLASGRWIRDPDRKKAELLEYYRVHGRPVPTSHPMRSYQGSRVHPSSELFDQEVLDAARAVGYRQQLDRDAYKGRKYGRFEVLSVDRPAGGVRQARVKCECGTIKTVRLGHLTSGATQSCGCLARELAPQRMAAVAAIPGNRAKATAARHPEYRDLLLDSDGEPAWTRPDADGRQTCIPCDGDGIDRREGGNSCCLNCDGEGYRWLERGATSWIIPDAGGRSA